MRKIALTSQCSDSSPASGSRESAADWRWLLRLERTAIHDTNRFRGLLDEHGALVLLTALAEGIDPRYAPFPGPGRPRRRGCRDNRFPCKVIRIGATYRVVTAELLHLMSSHRSP